MYVLWIDATPPQRYIYYHISSKTHEKPTTFRTINPHRYFDVSNGWVLVIFFYQTFRISYWHLLEQVRTLRNEIRPIWKNHIFCARPPTRRCCSPCCWCPWHIDHGEGGMMSLKLMKGGSIALLCKFASSRLICGVYGTRGSGTHALGLCQLPWWFPVQCKQSLYGFQRQANAAVLECISRETDEFMNRLLYQHNHITVVTHAPPIKVPVQTL